MSKVLLNKIKVIFWQVLKLGLTIFYIKTNIIYSQKEEVLQSGGEQYIMTLSTYFKKLQKRF